MESLEVNPLTVDIVLRTKWEQDLVPTSQLNLECNSPAYMRAFCFLSCLTRSILTPFPMPGGLGMLSSKTRNGVAVGIILFLLFLSFVYVSFPSLFLSWAA